MNEPKEAGTEKITVNLVPVDIGKIELLVDQGLFASRTDFIRAAIRKLLDEYAVVVTDAATRNFLNVGYVVFNEKSLKAALAKGQRLNIRSIGRFTLRDDVLPDTADKAIEAISVFGSVKMSPAVRERLADRIHPRSF
jgi:Arc/MetJ-type ribon-helix-helix transcriptional regulator